MRSLFSNASFARFDLGRHVLGQVTCPTGQMPMKQDGRVVCVKYSPPSGMFMPAGPEKSIAYGMAMGQTDMSQPYLNQTERDSLLYVLQSATSKIGPLQKLIDWSANNDPGLWRFLGGDASRFFALSDSLSPIQPDVNAIEARLADSDGESWWRPSAEEYAAIKQYTNALGGMWNIYQARKALPYTPAPGTTPPPALTPMAPEPVGLSTGNILLGGIVAIGLGYLISVLV